MSRTIALKKELQSYADPVKAEFLARFFKTAPGEYAYGDQFLGIPVPLSRTIARHFSDLSLPEITTLLNSPIHEERLVALLILVEQFKKRGLSEQEKIYSFYLGKTAFINNWDLVDLSADKIVGSFLLDKTDRSILSKLAQSTSIWEKRIAVIATFQFIKEQQYRDTFKVAELLLHDKHDLIHKAAGWMLREVGKRISQEKEEEFLKKHYRKIPRTMLRYAIECFPEEKRKKYLSGTIH